MSKGFGLQVSFLAVYLILVAAEVATSTLTCPPGTTTLITTGDVNEHSVEQDISSLFITVISSSPDFSDFFVASATPNTGYLQFKERFVLLGFSTTGQVVSGSDRYVSQLIVKTDSSFPENYNYTGEYNVNTVEEKYLPFDEPVLTSKIEFTVLDVVSGSSTIYYWKLRLFGCKEVNAYEIEPAQACPVLPSPSIVAAPPLPSCNEVVAPVINPSATNVQSSTQSDQMDTNMFSSSSEMRQVTVTVTETVSREVPVVGRAVSGNTSTAGLVGAVVPLLIIIMILATVLIVLLVLLYRKRSVLWVKKRGRSETLKGLPNIVYTHEDISINQPAIVPKKQTEEGMVVNELYGSGEGTVLPDYSSTYQQVGGAANLVEIQEGNEYSSIDQIYYPTSNASSTQYEYVNSKGMEEGGSGDGSPTVAAHIDSTMNPAYSSIGE